MEGERDARNMDWLSFATETVPLRDAAVQAAERERTERLRLIGENRWASTKAGRRVLCAALAVAALVALAMTGVDTR
jgi:hypothetical protein